jgi:hypothetical protein
MSFGTWLVSFGLVLVVACGTEDAGVDAGGDQCRVNVPVAERYLPLESGRSWTYQVTAAGQPVETKTQTIGTLEDVGGSKAGVQAFRVTTTKVNGKTVSWQEDQGACVQRHREQEKTLADVITVDQVFVPAKLRVDASAARLSVGASWTESYSEISTNPSTGQTTTVAKVQTWTVEALAESVTVPAGTFTCLKVRRKGNDAGQSDKVFWFAKGVGKIKEIGDQTEELMAFSMP